MAQTQNQNDASLDPVEKQLRDIIQTLYETIVTISDYAGPSSTELITEKMNLLISQYQELDRARDALDVLIPREIVMYVEGGRNPDIYTREFVEIVAKQNQIMNGRMRAFGDFRDILAEQINTAFPELRDDVNKVMRATGAGRAEKTPSAPKSAKSPSNAPVVDALEMA